MDTRPPAACWSHLHMTTRTETLMGRQTCTPASPTPKVGLRVQRSEKRRQFHSWQLRCPQCDLSFILFQQFNGVVYNYTPGGVCRDQTRWERCISVPLVRPDMFHLLAQWDQYLDRFSDGPMWDPAWHRFDEDHHNCFSFCLGFINGVLAVEGRSPLSRDSFAHTFILPRMRRVSKYTTLHQHIQRHQYYVVDQQEDQQEETPVKPGLFQ
ncbi:MKRN2 opposite strand protein isoform X2 [Channa argus]|uniref:MKRN2 opposite strand protein isoform X2 n=1 Tax=Channa argus TaxID=215402 RepID=UPI0035225EA7